MLTWSVQRSSRFHSPHQAGPGGVVAARLLPQRGGRGPSAPEQVGLPRLLPTHRRSQPAAGEARPLPGGKAGRSAELAGTSVPHRLRAGPERPRPAQAWRPVPVCVWGSRGRAWQLRVAPCPSHLPNRSNQVRARHAARAGVQAAGRGAGVADEPPRTPSAPLARTVQPPKWWQHLGRGHFLIARRVTVKLEFLTGRRTGSALRLGGVCTRCLRGPEESRLGTRGLRGALESCTRAASETVWSVTLSALRIRQCRSVVRTSALLRVTLANYARKSTKFLKAVCLTTLPGSLLKRCS